MSSIRLGNTVRYEDRLWIACGRSHRTDGTTRLILADEKLGDSVVALPDEVEDLGNFDRPTSHGGYTPPVGTEPTDGNRSADEAQP